MLTRSGVWQGRRREPGNDVVRGVPGWHPRIRGLLLPPYVHVRALGPRPRVAVVVGIRWRLRMDCAIYYGSRFWAGVRRGALASAGRAIVVAALLEMCA